MSGISIGPGVVPRPIGGKDYCTDLVIKTNLSSVDANVLQGVKERDVLPVVAEGVDGPVRVLADGKVLGTVLSSLLLELLNCINGGTEYEAVVENIDGAKCQVRIAAVK